MLNLRRETVEIRDVLTIRSQRGVPHRCAKPLPLQLDFVDDGHGPLLKHEDLSFTSAETDCFLRFKEILRQKD